MSIYQFYEYLNAFDSIPFETLQTLLAESIYGGHMNNIADLKCLKLFTEQFCSQEFCENGGKLANNTMKIEACFPDNYSTIESITSHIKSLDDKNDTSICELHPNANILREGNETNFLIENITLAQVSHTIYFPSTFKSLFFHVFSYLFFAFIYFRTVAFPMMK